MSTEITIAEAARRSGLSAHTLRYYMLERHRAAIAAQMTELEDTAAVLDRQIAMYHEMETTR